MSKGATKKVKGQISTYYGRSVFVYIVLIGYTAMASPNCMYRLACAWGQYLMLSICGIAFVALMISLTIYFSFKKVLKLKMHQLEKVGSLGLMMVFYGFCARKLPYWYKWIKIFLILLVIGWILPAMFLCKPTDQCKCPDEKAARRRLVEGGEGEKNAPGAFFFGIIDTCANIGAENLRFVDGGIVLFLVFIQLFLVWWGKGNVIIPPYVYDPIGPTQSILTKILNMMTP